MWTSSTILIVTIIMLLLPISLMYTFRILSGIDTKRLVNTSVGECVHSLAFFRTEEGQ